MADATLAFNIVTRYRDTGATAAARDMNKLSQSGSRMGGALKSAAKVGAVALGVGLVAVTKKSITLEAEFSKTMNVLQATAGASGAEMKSLSALAIKMGADTAFSASDASAAMLELARGGIKPAQIEAGALAGTMTLAAAGELGMADAANITVKAMGQFNLKGKDAASIAAALAGAANASTSNVSELSQALAAGGLAADSVNFSLQETTGVLAAFANNGLRGSDAGTSLKTMLDRLHPSTEKQATALDDLGLATGRFGSAFIKNNGEYKSAAQIAELLHNATEGLSASQRKAAITTIFGSDAQRAATILAKEGGKGIREMTKATSDQGSAQRAAAANMKGTAGALEAMRGSIETAMLAFGLAIQPLTIFGAKVVATIANGAVPIIQKFGDVLKKNLGQIDLKKITSGLGSLDMSGFAASFEGLGPAFSKLGAAIGKIDFGALRDALGEGVSDTISVFSVAIGFAADHVDTLAKYLPLLVAAFIAYKAAQGASNVVAIAHLPILAAQVVANLALASSQRALAAQLALLNGVERVGMLTRLRATAATVASTVASLAVSAATKAWAATQWLLNAALTANPIGLVVVAIALLVGGLVLAYKKSETFRKIVNGAFNAVKNVAVSVFNAVKNAAGAAFDWIKGHWKLILAILTGPFGIAVLVIAKNWSKIKDGAAKVKEFITDKFSSLIDWFKGIPSKITAATSGAWDGLKNGFRGVLNSIIGWWNNLSFGFPGVDKGPIHIPGVTISTPNIPYLAKGGIVNRPTLAMIGEAGPEAVVPLSRGGRDFGGGDITIPITLQLEGETVIRAILKYQRRTGKTILVGA
ncbi:MAG: phage tail tape measure protein [Phycisphaerales bacterium]